MISISGRELEQTFPFHLVLDEKMRVVQFGRSMFKLCASITVDGPWPDNLEIVHPKVAITADDFSQHAGELFVLRCEGDIDLKAELRHLKDQQVFVLFISPLFREISKLSQHNISLDDFANHDVAGDLLMLMQVQKRSIEDAREYSRRLQQSNQELHLQQQQLVEAHEALKSEMLQRDRIEKQLRKLSMAVESAGEAILITDKHAVIEYVNPAFCQITGYSQDEALGQTPSILKSGQQDERFYSELWQTINAGKVWHGTLIDRRKNGDHFPVFTSIAPIFSEQGEITHFVAVQQDMSERQQLEEQLFHSQKMEAIGTLAGGIAHDFNNMLAAVIGNLYLIRRGLQDGEPVEKRVDNIEMISGRAAEMIKKLLTFARKDSPALQSFLLDSFVEDTYVMAKAGFPEKINVSLNLACKGLFVRGDPIQLQQVLLNLLTNARDAVKQTSLPAVEVRSERFEATEAFRMRHPDQEQDLFVRLSVSDNGSGMSKETIEKIFEPFFTTKAVGEGSGLGLSMVYGAIKNHQGEIEIESEQGQGSKFTLYLPLAQTVQQAAVKRPEVELTDLGELVLLVDDEQELLDTTCEVLEALGFAVLTATDGEQAYALYKQHSNEIKLLLLDVVMPVLGGVELAKRLREEGHQTPIIFATGYGKDQLPDSDEPVPNSCVINKPFSVGSMSQLMQQMLSGGKD